MIALCPEAIVVPGRYYTRAVHVKKGHCHSSLTSNPNIKGLFASL